MVRDKISGVYIIQSVSHSDRVYIGSSKDILHRLADHKYLLRKNKHYSKKLQSHFNKYGESDLVFDIIENGSYLCNKHLLAREQGWCYFFQYKDTWIPYFNYRMITDSPVGVKASDETRRKMSRNRKGVKHTVEHNKKISIAMKGIKRSKEVVARQREIGKQLWVNRPAPMTGRKQSQETIKKIREKLIEHNKIHGNYFKGKHHTEESKAKIGDKNRGRPQSEETKRKRTAALLATLKRKREEKNQCL